MKKLCKRIITFSLVLCMAFSVFTGVVYAADTDTVVILYTATRKRSLIMPVA